MEFKNCTNRNLQVLVNFTLVNIRRGSNNIADTTINHLFMKILLFLRDYIVMFVGKRRPDRCIYLPVVSKPKLYTKIVIFPSRYLSAAFH